MVDTVSNPFYNFNQQIVSPQFEQQVLNLIDSFSNQRPTPQKKHSVFKARTATVLPSSLISGSKLMRGSNDADKD